MPFPPSSPDLNPIEAVWKIIKQDIYTGRLQTSEAEMVAKIENGWRRLDTRVLQIGNRVSS